MAQTNVLFLDSFYTDERMEIDGVLEDHEHNKNLTTTYTAHDYVRLK